MQLSKHINLSNAHLTASTTDVLTVEVDCSGAEGVLFVGYGSTLLGTLTVGHAASTTASFVSLGSSVTYATSAGKFIAAVDIYRPRKRWLQAQWTASGNGYQGLMAFKYCLRELPQATWTSTTNLPSTGGGVRSCISPSSTA